MSQLKEQNGRYYQEVEVVMLATDKTSKIHLESINSKKELVLYTKNLSCGEFQHLYFLSDSEIHEGEWFMPITNGKAGEPKKANEYKINNKETYQRWEVVNKKIIATTDESLNYLKGSNDSKLWIIPKPSDSFIRKYIEEYNAGRQITKVLVEFENIQTTAKEDYFYVQGKGSNLNYINRLKIDSNNTITIKKVKDSYSREEVAKMLHVVGTLSYEYGLYVMKKGGVSRGDFTITDWIDKNL